MLSTTHRRSKTGTNQERHTRNLLLSRPNSRNHPKACWLENWNVVLSRSSFHFWSVLFFCSVVAIVNTPSDDWSSLSRAPHSLSLSLSLSLSHQFSLRRRIVCFCKCGVHSETTTTTTPPFLFVMVTDVTSRRMIG